MEENYTTLNDNSNIMENEIKEEKTLTKLLSLLPLIAFLFPFLFFLPLSFVSPPLFIPSQTANKARAEG